MPPQVPLGILRCILTHTGMPCEDMRTVHGSHGYCAVQVTISGHVATGATPTFLVEHGFFKYFWLSGSSLSKNGGACCSAASLSRHILKNAQGLELVMGYMQGTVRRGASLRKPFSSVCRRLVCVEGALVRHGERFTISQATAEAGECMSSEHQGSCILRDAAKILTHAAQPMLHVCYQS